MGVHRLSKRFDSNSGAGVTVAQADESSKKCAAFDTITLGKYYVNNNLWGQEKGTAESYSVDIG
ncbi:hypothetical protein ACFWIO_10980 [Streptomyces diastatochromogenes]|uniref:hypothetical protein n=1 Tax=Streptomyces diastatochromogenes TaxID=42236 RepID=UPI003649DA0A